MTNRKYGLDAASSDSAPSQRFLALIPESMHGMLVPLVPNLVDVQMDVGTIPTALLIDGTEVDLSQEPTTFEELTDIANRVGKFDSRKRVGIDGELHRVCAIKTLDGELIGMTLRYGRPVAGAFDLVEDVLRGWLIEDRAGNPLADMFRKSVMILGRPGSGKSTLLRSAVGFAAQTLGKTVATVDTGELFGSGKVPHPIIGRGRRFFTSPERQKQTMIEVLEGHTPTIIAVDQMSSRAEVEAAVTIRQRGVCLIGTVHGSNLRSLIYNDDLVRLIGGRDKETVGDKTMLRRGLNLKTVEVSPSRPVFDVCIELLDRESMLIYRDVQAAVASLLAKDDDRIEVEFRTRRPFEVVKFNDRWSGKLSQFERAWESRPRRAA
jgi:stage III sporulation protein SpoIIIAA